MTINYFDLYSLNFCNLNNFFAEIEAFPNDNIKSKLYNARIAKRETERFQQEEPGFEFIKSFMTTQVTNPGLKDFLKKGWESWCTGRKNYEELKARFQGADPYEIQHCVNIILGISEDEGCVCPLELREAYFLMMQKTDFLMTKYGMFNGIDSKYQPGILAARFLEENPQIQTLTIGCGWEAKNIRGICYEGKRHEHIHESFNIDLYASIGPDLVVDMHNSDFWAAIPDQRFEIIQDHTNMCILLESDQTIQAIFRTLKPGGFLRMLSAFYDNHIVQLNKVGFVVTDRYVIPDTTDGRGTEVQKPVVPNTILDGDNAENHCTLIKNIGNGCFEGQ